MADDGSITHWFDALQAGDREAAQRLWERFSCRLINLARVYLRAAPRRVADEEDAALSAFDSFCRGAELGRFPELDDRSKLWGLLVTITVRKVRNQVAHAKRQKRGGGNVVSESELLDRDQVQSLDHLIGSEPTPELALELAEECQRLLNLLGDGNLRSVALLRLEGYTDQEIADRLACARSTVQRRLNLIQACWEKEQGS